MAQVICTSKNLGSESLLLRCGKSISHLIPWTWLDCFSHIRDCRFPHAGVFSIQFWYNNEMLEERILVTEVNYGASVGS